MNILLTFATNSGSTQQAAQLVSESLTARGHTVTTKMIKDTTPNELTTPDLLIFASPSWDYEGKEGQPHEDYFPFMKAAEQVSLAGKPCAVIGLGDSTYTIFCGAVAHLEEFVNKLGGTLIVPSLKIDGFFYNMDKSTKDTTAWAETLATTLQK